MATSRVNYDRFTADTRTIFFGIFDFQEKETEFDRLATQQMHAFLS